MVRKATTKRAKKPKHAHKQMENKLTQATPHQHPHHHPANSYDIMTKMSGVKANPIGELGSLEPDLYDMIMHIKSSINLKQVKRYADVKKIPEAARTSLAVFFVDWGGNDLNHEEYLKNVPSGFSKPVALQMGDLLYWCMGGGTARQQWNSIISKTSENKNGDIGKAKKATPLDFPLGMKMQDLTGLHVELLNMLPQKKYTHYTLNQLFLENRTIYDSLFDTFVALDPMEHDTLQVLEKIVKMGNIERFRLAMMHGTKGKIRSMLKEGTFGANLLEAFAVARKATEAYSRGEYDDARLGLERLQGEYGLSPDLFQLGLRDMFIIHAGAVSATSGGKDAKFTMKGSNIPLLVSIDKTVGPGSGWAGMKNIRDAMSGAAVKYNANGAIGGFAPQLGTPGGRIFQSTKGAMISTDWLYFFGALNTKSLKNLTSVKLSAVTEGDTTTPGLQGDQRTARLLIHARLDNGFEDLVPKGTLTVTVRPTGVDAGQAQRKADRRSVAKKGGKKKNEEKKAAPRDIIQIGTGATQSYIGQVDLIFEDYGALFGSADKAAGGIYKDATKVSPKQLDAADEASAQDVQEMFDSMQPDAVSGTEEPTEAMLDEAENYGLSRRGAKARMTLGLDYHDYIGEVKKILKKEGGAAGLKPLKAAFPKGTNKAQAQRMLAQMPGVVLHADGDYILVDTLANAPFYTDDATGLMLPTEGTDPGILNLFVKLGETFKRERNQTIEQATNNVLQAQKAIEVKNQQIARLVKAGTLDKLTGAERGEIKESEVELKRLTEVLEKHRNNLRMLNKGYAQDFNRATEPARLQEESVKVYRAFQDSIRKIQGTLANPSHPEERPKYRFVPASYPESVHKELLAAGLVRVPYDYYSRDEQMYQPNDSVGAEEEVYVLEGYLDTIRNQTANFKRTSFPMLCVSDEGFRIIGESFHGGGPEGTYERMIQEFGEEYLRNLSWGEFEDAGPDDLEIMHDSWAEEKPGWEGFSKMQTAVAAYKDAVELFLKYDYYHYTDLPSGERIERDNIDEFMKKKGVSRRRAKSAKGGGRSMGQTIVIELTPKSSIKPSTSREDAKWLKMVKKDSEGLTKLYNKFAKSSSRTPAQEGRVKKGKKKGEGITGGSYLVYKGGQTGLRMIKARRKDNNEFVPWLLMIPHILVRHGNNDMLEAKKGSASYAPTKELLELVELYFGKPKFKTNLGMGGFRLISERTARRLKQEGSAGKKVVDLALHEGVKKIFTTPGLRVGALKGRTDWSNARPSRYKSTGDISYQTRDGNGKLEFLEQSKKVKA